MAEVIEVPDTVHRLTASLRVTTYLEMSGNLTAVGKMSGILVHVREMS